jgi:antitoxin component of RelBE/YafQ-DinJ toxin-antitoxin module
MNKPFSITFRCSGELKNSIKAIAERYGLSESFIIHNILKQGVNYYAETSHNRDFQHKENAFLLK